MTGQKKIFYEPWNFNSKLDKKPGTNFCISGKIVRIPQICFAGLTCRTRCGLQFNTKEDSRTKDESREKRHDL